MLKEKKMQIEKEETRKNQLRCAGILMLIAGCVVGLVKKIYDITYTFIEFRSSYYSISGMLMIAIIVFLGFALVWFMFSWSIAEMEERIEDRVSDMKVAELLRYLEEHSEVELELNYRNAIENDVFLSILENCGSYVIKKYEHIYVREEGTDYFYIWACDENDKEIWHHICRRGNIDFLCKYFELIEG